VTGVARHRAGRGLVTEDPPLLLAGFNGDARVATR